MPPSARQGPENRYSQPVFTANPVHLSSLLFASVFEVVHVLNLRVRDGTLQLSIGGTSGYLTLPMLNCDCGHREHEQDEI